MRSKIIETRMSHAFFKGHKEEFDFSVTGFVYNRLKNRIYSKGRTKNLISLADSWNTNTPPPLFFIFGLKTKSSSPLYLKKSKIRRGVNSCYKCQTRDCPISFFYLKYFFKQINAVILILYVILFLLK